MCPREPIGKGEAPGSRALQMPEEGACPFPVLLTTPKGVWKDREKRPGPQSA